MKRRSQTQAQMAKDDNKKTKATSGALTVSQLSSDVIWQVGTPLRSLGMPNHGSFVFSAGIAILGS